MSDEFGDRMKLYEGAEAGRRLMPLLPVIARLDGKSFHTFTKDMGRPYDKRLSDLMVATTKFLVEQTNACMGYTQSDEITLGWLSTSFDSQIFFDGRVQKMNSVLASMCTAFFNDQFPVLFGHKQPRLALFDSRVYNVPNPVEGANAFLWREMDATKNSISMAARAFFSHKALENKNGSEMQEMLWADHKVNWNDYPSFFKRGTYVQRRTRTGKFTAEELDKLPPLHNARRNPDLVIERSSVEILDMPPFRKVTNRPQVIFEGAEPILLES